jgi:hypothetical protein
MWAVKLILIVIMSAGLLVFAELQRSTARPQVASSRLEVSKPEPRPVPSVRAEVPKSSPKKYEEPEVLPSESLIPVSSKAVLAMSLLDTTSQYTRPVQDTLATESWPRLVTYNYPIPMGSVPAPFVRGTEYRPPPRIWANYPEPSSIGTLVLFGSGYLMRRRRK